MRVRPPTARQPESTVGSLQNPPLPGFLLRCEPLVGHEGVTIQPLDALGQRAGMTVAAPQGDPSYVVKYVDMAFPPSLTAPNEVGQTEEEDRCVIAAHHHLYPTH